MVTWGAYAVWKHGVLWYPRPASNFGKCTTNRALSLSKGPLTSLAASDRRPHWERVPFPVSLPSVWCNVFIFSAKCFTHPSIIAPSLTCFATGACRSMPCNKNKNNPRNFFPRVCSVCLVPHQSRPRRAAGCCTPTVDALPWSCGEMPLVRIGIHCPANKKSGGDKSPIVTPGAEGNRSIVKFRVPFARLCPCMNQRPSNDDATRHSTCRCIIHIWHIGRSLTAIAIAYVRILRSFRQINSATTLVFRLCRAEHTCTDRLSTF